MSRPVPNLNVSSPWLHRLAWLTAALTLLLPVTTGSIVTTLKAGMVFADWPSSDGYSFLSYPWLQSARDQFVEHGHRLSGGTIGIVCLILIIATWTLDRRPLVRWIGTGIFLAVLAQVLLGGARVLFDKQTLALLHGDFAALVFSLMSILVLVTSPGWESRSRLQSSEQSQSLGKGAMLLLSVVAAQYVMGGFLRHLRERAEFAWAWMVHPWFAAIVVLATVLFFFAARDAKHPYLTRCSWALVGLAIAQSLVGLATWYVRYGIPSWGVIAQQDSPAQIVICSLHKVVGVMTLMISVMTVFCWWNVRALASDDSSNLVVSNAVAGVTT